MASEWYYKNATNEERGPFSSADLKRLASEGRIRSSTMVRKAVDGRWVAASNVKGLVDGGAATENAIVPPPPEWFSPAARVSRKPEKEQGERPPPVSRSPSNRDVAAAQLSEAPAKRGYSPAMLVGAGVGGTLLAVGLVALGAMLAGRNNTPSPSQSSPNTSDRDRAQFSIAKDQPNSAGPAAPSKETSTIVPKAFTSPEAVVKAYLAAKAWEDRLPFVFNAADVRPQMAQYYYNDRFVPDSFVPGTIISVEGPLEPIGAKCLVTVDMSTSTPNLPRWSYAVVRTQEGFKVDWVESRALMRKAEKAALQKKLGNAEVAVELLRWNQSSSDAEYEFKLTNKSDAVISYVKVTLDVLNAKGAFLGNNYTNELNIRPGLPFVETIRIHNVKVGDIASWKLTLERVNVVEKGGEEEEAMTLFTLNETLGNPDRKYHKRLEDCLHGHWRESRLSSPFKSQGTYFFSSTAPEVVRIDDDGNAVKCSIEVLERNYSSGMLKLRLLSPNLGFQFDLTPGDDKSFRVQLTELSRDGKRFEEIEEEARPRCVNEWTYIDQKDRP